MLATTPNCGCRNGVPQQTPLLHSPLYSSRTVFQSAPRLHRSRQHGLQVQNAISREKKEATVDKLVQQLEKSTVVFGLRMKNIDVKTMQQFRKEMPSTVLVAKNTLVKLAADKVEGWSELKNAAQGDNSWVFVEEESIKESVKVYLKFEDKMLRKVPKEERDKGVTGTSISGAVMSGRYLTYDEFKKLERLPDKQELIATIARLIKQVPTKVAVGVKMVPTKLAYGIKAMADADDNKDLLVGDVCKPKPAES